VSQDEASSHCFGIRRFLSDRSGSTAVIFAIALMPLAVATGAAMDYSRASATRAELQKALDAAVLAAAIEASKGGLATTVQGVVQSYFKANAKLTGNPEISSSVDNVAGAVAATAQLPVQTSFRQLAGIASIPVSATSQAIYSVGMSEIALALDTTGSMSGAKLQAAQQANLGAERSQEARAAKASERKVKISTAMARRATRAAERRIKIAKVQARKLKLAMARGVSPQTADARGRAAIRQQRQYSYNQRSGTPSLSNGYASAYAPQTNYGPFGSGRTW
jgi:Flp pilus assembly protein TadG